MNKYTVIGPGNVGITLSLFLEKKGMLGSLLFNSESSKKNAINSGIELDRIEKFQDHNFDSEIILICVQDQKIEEVSKSLSNLSLHEKIIIHTSGLMSYDVLSNLSKNNIVGSAHPYQTFYNQAPEILNNIGWGISCQKSDYDNINSVVKVFDGKCSYLDDDKKPLYHASAVAASNYLNLLFDLSAKLLDEAGVDKADFLPQIMQTTLDNNINLLSEETIALTGPIIRKDFKTIEAHINSMIEPDIKKSYSSMGISLAIAAKRLGILNESESNRFISILEKGKE